MKCVIHQEPWLKKKKEKSKKQKAKSKKQKAYFKLVKLPKSGNCRLTSSLKFDVLSANLCACEQNMFE